MITPGVAGQNTDNCRSPIANRALVSLCRLLQQSITELKEQQALAVTALQEESKVGCARNTPSSTFSTAHLQPRAMTSR